ncbi:hypothetical protein CF065_18785 [Clostridium sporogenes]
MFRRVKATANPFPGPASRQYSNPIIIKAGKYLSATEMEKLKEILNKLGFSKASILPEGMEVIELGKKEINYRIFTKDDYKRYRLSRMKASNISISTIKNIEESWEKTSKGYNFIIGVGQQDNLMFYGIDYFNNNVLGNVL